MQSKTLPFSKVMTVNLTVSVALQLLQPIQNSDRIAICCIQPNCKISQNFEQTVKSQNVKVQSGKI